MDEKIEMTPEMEYFSAKLKTLPYDYTAKILTRTSRNQTGLKIKKIDCVSEFSARKNAKIFTKVLKYDSAQKARDARR